MKTVKGVLGTILVSLLGCSPGFAATLVVTNNHDSGAGSLRQAVLDNNLLGGSNTIIFVGVTGTVALSSGELLMTNNASVIGPGAKALAVQGNYSSRIFRVANAAVSISGLTICNGSNSLGGGILQQGGTLSLSGCTVLSNKAINGGGIAQTNGTLFLSDCTISSNSVVGTGMGIYAQSNVLTRLRGCTLAGNSGTGFTSSGGGITHNGTALVLETCTFCGNGSPGGNGGGLLNTTGSAAITNCTFFGNRSFVGGGVSAGGGSVLIRNSILAGNTSIGGAGGAPDCSGPVISAGFNLVGNATNSTGWGNVGDQLGSTSLPLNPLLGPLQANGGPTWTMALLNGSPAIDKGHSSGAATDQRGALRPHDKGSVPNAPGGDAGDIGAYETGATTLIVSNLNIAGPGSLQQAVLDANAEDVTTINFAPNVIGIIWPGGELLLDKNIVINGPGASLLAVAGGYNSRVFTVKYGASVIISGLTIQDGQQIGSDDEEEGEDGETVEGGAILNQEKLSMFDCVITNNIAKGGKGGTLNGSAARPGGHARGGAIANLATLALTRCVLAGNYAQGGDGGEASGGGSDGPAGNALGGALYNEGIANLTNCTIHGNTVAPGFSTVGQPFGQGGGIYNYYVANVMNCTIAINNLAPAGATLGGGIYDDGSFSVVRNTTIAGNNAFTGGGVFCSGNMNFGNTIIAGNSAMVGPDARGTILSSDYNLVQDTTDLIINGPTVNSIFGQDPMLVFLGNHGGPVPTMPALSGSPVIDRGFSFGLTTDQRGEMRPFDFDEVPNSGGDGSDIGAFELQGVFRPRLSIAPSGNNIVLSWPTNAAAFRLESTTNSMSSASWATVAGTPSISGGRFVLTNSVSGKRFYRLTNP